jgi:hypothetical protein
MLDIDSRTMRCKEEHQSYSSSVGEDNRYPTYTGDGSEMKFPNGVGVIDDIEPQKEISAERSHDQTEKKCSES